MGHAPQGGGVMDKSAVPLLLVVVPANAGTHTP